MAHYVFQRNNGYGDFDYIRSFETMEITDYPEQAAQVDDRYMAYIDIPYLNSLGFFAVGITSLALRILPMLLFQPLTRGFRPRVAPRPPRPHVPRPATVVAPRAPRAPRVAAPRPVTPRAPRAPQPPMGRGPVGGPARGPMGGPGGPMGGPGFGPMGGPDPRGPQGGRGGRGPGR